MIFSLNFYQKEAVGDNRFLSEEIKIIHRQCYVYLKFFLCFYFPTFVSNHKIIEAEFSNLGLSGIQIEDSYPEKYDRLLCGGIWCIIQLEYAYQK